MASQAGRYTPLATPLAGLAFWLPSARVHTGMLRPGWESKGPGLSPGVPASLATQESHYGGRAGEHPAQGNLPATGTHGYFGQLHSGRLTGTGWRQEGGVQAGEGSTKPQPGPGRRCPVGTGRVGRSRPAASPLGASISSGVPTSQGPWDRGKHHARSPPTPAGSRPSVFKIWIFCFTGTCFCVPLDSVKHG